MQNIRIFINYPATCNDIDNVNDFVRNTLILSYFN